MTSNPTPSAAETQAVPTSATTALSILIVDDEDGIRNLLVHWLKQEGHDVRCASDGGEATALLGSRSFDLLITDVVMPERDGFEVIASFRKQQPRARILAISGGGRYLMGDDCLKVAKGLGAHAVVMKPFDLTQLRTAMKIALGPTEPLPGIASKRPS